MALRAAPMFSFGVDAPKDCSRGAGTKMQNAIAIRHVAFEDAGTLEGVLEDRGIALSYLEAGVDDLAPAKDADLLLVLGGPIRDRPLSLHQG
jgi:hypothetical protein